MRMPNGDEMLDKVEIYRKIVLNYERLNQEINQLLSTHGGTEQMSAEDLNHYRELARQRDEALNEMRWLELELLDEDTKH